MINKKRLGSVISINPDSRDFQFQYEFIDYIDISSICEGNLEKITKIKTINAPSRARRLVKSGDTILSTVRPNLRAFLYLKNPSPETVVSTGFAVLRASEKINSRFLYYSVINQEFTDYLTNNAKGSAYPAVDAETIARAEITFHALPSQQKIAAILSAYDDLIENNTRRIKILQEMMQVIYHEYFVNFRFPGHDSVKMVESDMGPIPRGWKVKTVEETFEISGGGTPSTKVHEYWESGTINWYSPVDLTAAGTMFIDRSGNQINELGLKKSSAKLFPPYCVMMTSRATLGVISINTTDACTNQGFITCIPNEQFPLYTLYHWLKENVEMFISLGTGSTFKEITKGVFKTIQLVVPTPDVISQFEKTIQPLALHILNLQRKNANLRRTRDLLLPKLISGELDVSELDIRLPEAEA